MASDTSTASELTQEQVQKILVQPLEQASTFLASSPRIFDTDGNQVRIPKLTSMEEPSWHGENEQITEVDSDFDEIVLLPSTMKSVKSLTRFSNELARQSVVALDAALRDRMVTDVAAKLDAAFYAGDGGTPAGTEPVGMLSWPDTQELPGIGAIDLDDFLDALGLAMAANVDISRCRWFMRSETFIGVRKLKETTTGRHLVQPDPTQDALFRLHGVPVTITNRIPVDTVPDPDSTSVALADMSKVAVARDTAPSVKILDQTYGDYDQLAIRVTSRYDTSPMNPEAVVILRGVNL